MAKDAAAPKKTEAHSPAPTPATGGQGGDHKKAEPVQSARKGHNPLPGGCHAWGCKVQATRFNFCEEHFDHFKFGLIKKTGERVSDYDKKIEHYQAHQQQRGATPLRKVA
jgi:hypothetical protein